LIVKYDLPDTEPLLESLQYNDAFIYYFLLTDQHANVPRPSVLTRLRLLLLETESCSCPFDSTTNETNCAARQYRDEEPFVS
jgi:hypothetical protein